MSFSSILGNRPAIRALQNALAEDRLPATYIFAGPQGVGKTTLALSFAQAVACLSPNLDPFDACGTCDSCRTFIAGSHPEIVLIPPAGDQTQIWQFWDRDGKPAGALQRSIRYTPVVGRKRVFIIERADTLNEAAANSLLKVLEEPPPFVLFILLAPHTARMLATVLSRAQVIRLAPMPVDELVNRLAEIEAVEPARARLLATFAEGRPGTALSLARSKETVDEMNAILDVAGKLPFADPLAAPKLAEEIRKVGASVKALTGSASPANQSAEDDSSDGGPREKLGRKQLGILVDLLVTFYRDLLSLRLGGRQALLSLDERREALAALAAGSTHERWQRNLEALLLARRRIDQNANVRLLTDWLTIKLIAEAR